jgi:hypothetical protein
MVGQPNLDLTLASSYIPAFMCLGKSLLATVLAWFLLPVNGLPTLGVLLLLDRLFLNSDFIVDVNALTGLLTGLRVVAYARTTANANMAQLGLGLAWAALGGVQLVRPLARPRIELLLQCAVLVGLSWTVQPLENLAYAIARTSSYIVLTLGHVYWMTANQDEEPLALTAVRFGPVVLCNTSLAAGTSLIGMLVIVYKYKYRWHHHRDAVEGGSSDNHDTEAALLRDQLARCKDNRSL